MYLDASIAEDLAFVLHGPFPLKLVPMGTLCPEMAHLVTLLASLTCLTY